MLQYLSLLILMAGLYAPINASTASTNKFHTREEDIHRIPVGNREIFIAIPSSFQTTFEHVGEQGSQLYEYIENTETPNTWTKALNIHVLPTALYSYNAKTIALRILSEMFGAFHPIEMRKESDQILLGGTQQYRCWASYINPETGCHELIFMSFLAAEKRCAGWFYTFRNKDAPVDHTKASNIVSKFLEFCKAKHEAEMTDNTASSRARRSK